MKQKKKVYKQLRYRFWRKGFVGQHCPSKISELLSGVFDFAKIKFGNIKKGEGDVVLVKVGKNEWITLEKYLGYFLDINKIETKGIYTNLFFGRKFFVESIKEIVKK